MCPFSSVSGDEFVEATDDALPQTPDKGEDIPEVDVEAQSLYMAEYAHCHRDPEVTSGCRAQTNIESNFPDVKYSSETKACNSRKCFSSSLICSLDTLQEEIDNIQ